MDRPIFCKAPFLDKAEQQPSFGKRGKNSRGGAAIEYIIVSTFAMLMALGAIVFVSKAVKTKIAKLEEKLGVTFDGEALDIFK